MVMMKLEVVWKGVTAVYMCDISQGSVKDIQKVSVAGQV